MVVYIGNSMLGIEIVLSYIDTSSNVSVKRIMVIITGSIQGMFQCACKPGPVTDCNYVGTLGTLARVSG